MRWKASQEEAWITSLTTPGGVRPRCLYFSALSDSYHQPSLPPISPCSGATGSSKRKLTCPRLYRPSPLRHSSRDTPDIRHQPLRRNAYLRYVFTVAHPLPWYHCPDRLPSRGNPLRLWVRLQRFESCTALIQRYIAGRNGAF